MNQVYRYPFPSDDEEPKVLVLDDEEPGVYTESGLKVRGGWLEKDGSVRWFMACRPDQLDEILEHTKASHGDMTIEDRRSSQESTGTEER